ncbi:phytoene/squalene synthase family protein [Arthrobacter monumenti]
MSTKAQADMYNRVAHEAAALVISRYSTSFSLACRLLEQPVRRHVQNIYALVRVADEIVDGAASGSGAGQHRVRECLDGFELETEEAMRTGYSSNLISHSFAVTAREVGITTDLTRPFFASMRSDLSPIVHTPETLQDYIYGSAEVVGLMCVRAFLSGRYVPAAEMDMLDGGARRLGAAFQKVNFLRDLAQDTNTLDRRYLPALSISDLNEAAKDAVLRDIYNDLDAALPAIAKLPRSSRYAVAAAQSLFRELADRIARTPAATLAEERIRVPNPRKLRLTALTLLTQQVSVWPRSRKRTA